MVNIVIVWIPAHQGILFHDTADGLARATARDIFTGTLSAPCAITYYVATKVAADIAIKSWQVKWNQDVTGLVLLRFQKFCRRSVLVGFARKTAVFGSVSVLSAYGHIVLQLSSSQVRMANNRIHAIMHSKQKKSYERTSNVGLQMLKNIHLSSRSP